MQHENIVKLVDAFERPGSLVIVTELLAGGTLQGYLMDREHLLEREAGFLSKEMFLSVGYLHSKSIVHRDVKPATRFKAPRWVWRVRTTSCLQGQDLEKAC